jgi:hypothetical protein
MESKTTNQAEQPVEQPVVIDRHLDDVTIAYVEECISANMALHDKYGGPKPTLPVVQLEPPEITFGGKVFKVTGNQALAFQKMRDRHPDRVSLSKEVGHHPSRYIETLPDELKALVDTDARGSRLNL